MSSSTDDSRLELEPAAAGFRGPPQDHRPHMPEPPLVRLTAIEDVVAIVPEFIERALDDFYVTLLQFERDRNSGNRLVYRAENFRLLLEIHATPITRKDMRAIAVEVASLVDAEAKVIEREIEYQRIRGLTAGSDALMLQDPAGNWVSISERRGVR
ncbi:MAG: hypothetical protein H7Z14_03720 [Anaerolineae bacterium]|nr:hypothetical protein [Phycisphaerae bacterium]